MPMCSIKFYRHTFLRCVEHRKSLQFGNMHNVPDNQVHNLPMTGRIVHLTIEVGNTGLFKPRYIY